MVVGERTGWDADADVRPFGLRRIDVRPIARQPLAGDLGPIGPRIPERIAHRMDMGWIRLGYADGQVVRVRQVDRGLDRSVLAARHRLRPIDRPQVIDDRIDLLRVERDAGRDVLRLGRWTGTELGEVARAPWRRPPRAPAERVLRQQHVDQDDRDDEGKCDAWSTRRCPCGRGH